MASRTTSQYWADTYADPFSEVNKSITLDVATLTAYCTSNSLPLEVRLPLERVLWHLDNIRGAK